MKKILIVLSEYGYWGEELIGPYETLDKFGYDMTFVTPTGRRPHALTASKDSASVDPPLNKHVVSEEMAEKVTEFDESTILDNPLNLTKLIGIRPYLSEENYLRKYENYSLTVDQAAKELKGYDALLLVGGSGPVIDMANNERVHDLIKIFAAENKPVAAECYGVACLAFARDLGLRKSLIWGRHVTGHPIEFDYIKNDTGFYGTDFLAPTPLYPLEYVLRDAVGPEGEFHGNVGKETSVIVDYPFITARSTGDSYKCGEMLVKVLEEGVQRYGW